MEDQWLLLALVAAKAAGPAVPLLEAGPLHQISRDVSRLHLGHIPGHHFAAPDIDHHIEVQPHTPPPASGKKSAWYDPSTRGPNHD